MKKFVSIIFSVLFLLTGCNTQKVPEIGYIKYLA